MMEHEVTRLADVCDTDSCGYKAMSVPATCVEQGGGTAFSDMAPKQMIQLLCEDGQCKTGLDGAVSACEAAGDSQMMESMGKMQTMCHPCMKALVDVTEKCMDANG